MWIFPSGDSRFRGLHGRSAATARLSARLVLASLMPTLLCSEPVSLTISDAEYAECKAWYERADFIPLTDLPLVRVATGGWWSSGGKKHNTFMVGFLKEVDEQGGFTVTTISRDQHSFISTGDEVGEAEAVGFQKLHFKEWLETYLAGLDGAEAEGPFHRDELIFAGPFSGSPSSPGLTCVHLAMECERRGYPAEARTLMNRLPRMLVQGDDEHDELPLVDRIEEALGHLLMWQAVVACDDPANSREDLLQRFRKVVRMAPKSRHTPQARQMANRLEQMIEEDAVHEKERKKRPYATLSKDEQIADLVFQLRNQDGAQWSQPGSCSIFSFRDDADTPADRLVEIGFDAVPRLIDALLDESLTYSVGYHRDFYFSHRVLTVGDAAEQVITRITGVPLPEPPNIRVFGEDPKQDKEHALRAAKQKAALDWWLEFQNKGERQFLIETVSAGGQAGCNLATRLAERYREDALEAMKAGLEKSSEAWAYGRYVWAIGQAGFEESGEIVLRVIEENRFPEGTLAALEWLASRKPDEAVRLASGLLDDEETWEVHGDFDERFADDLLEFLVETNTEAALKAVLRVIEKMNVSQRVDAATEILSSMDEDTAPASREIAEEILVALLADRRRRTGMSGSIGDFSYSDPRICDLAGAALNHHWPSRYKFDYEATPKVRNHQAIECANRWRRERGQPLLKHDERVLHRMTADAFDALVRQHGDLSDPSNLEGLVETIEQEGTAALEPLIAYTKTAPSPVRERLESVALDLANRVEQITVLPEGLTYPPVERWIEGAQGRSLDGESVVALLSSFFRKADANGEPVRGIEFEALRHGDLTGIDVNIRLVKRDRPGDELDQWDGSETVIAGNEPVHEAGYGGGLSKDDPKESEDLREGVDEALATTPGTPCEIRWKLIGWWHDD